MVNCKKGVVLSSMLALLFLCSGLRSQSLTSISSVERENKRLSLGKKPIKVEYKIIIAGELRDAIASKSEGRESYANASFGITRSDSRTGLTFMIKVLDNQNSITDNFGSALLNPSGLERASGYGDLIIRNFRLFRRKADFRLYGTISTSNWIVPDPENPDLTKSLQATISTIGIGGYKEIWTTDIVDDNEKLIASIRSHVFFGCTSRWISGDLAFKENAEARENIIMRRKKMFFAPEFYCDFLYNGIKGFADITWFGLFKSDIRGFTGVRVTLGIGLQTDVIIHRIFDP